MVFFPSPFRVFFFKIDLNGNLIAARFGINLLKWKTAPKSDLGCFELLGRSLSPISCIFVVVVEMTLPVNIKPSPSMLT